MGMLFSRRSSAREVILALEVKIEAKEKQLKSLQKRKTGLCSFFARVLLVLNFASVVGVWVCKETLSWSVLFRGIWYTAVFDVLLLLSIAAINRVYQYRLEKSAGALRRMKEAQRRN